MNKCLLWVCQSIYLFSFTISHMYLDIFSWGSSTNRDKVSRFIWVRLSNILQKKPSPIVLFIFKSYRFLGPVFGDLSEEPLPEDVQVVRDAQSSASRIVPHRKTIP